MAIIESEIQHGQKPEFSDSGSQFLEVVGPTGDDLAVLPYELINIAPQMRGKIDAEHAEELSQSIERVGLQTGPIVYLLSPEQAAQYLNVANKVWGGKHVLDDFAACDEGYLVLSAGEHRMHATKLYAERKGLSIDEVGVSAQLKQCESVADIMADQIAENLQLEPKPERFAIGLIWIYELGKASGRFESEGDFIKNSPVSESRTRRALHYFKLPETARQSVDEGLINYSHAVAMYQYLDVYKQYLADKGVSPESFDRLANLEFRSKIQLIVANGWSVRETERSVRSWAHDMAHLQRSFADEFTNFVDAEAEEEMRILNSRKQVHNNAASALENSASALTMFYDDDVHMEGISPQLARHLDALGKNLEVLVRRFGDTEIGQIAAQKAAEIDFILESAPVEVQEGFSF